MDKSNETPTKQGPGENAHQSLGQAKGQGILHDDYYNLISVLYHAMKGQEVYRKYEEDSADSGSNDLRKFFEKVQQEEISRIKEATELLKKYSSMAESSFFGNKKGDVLS